MIREYLLTGVSECRALSMAPRPTILTTHIGLCSERTKFTLLTKKSEVEDKGAYNVSSAYTTVKIQMVRVEIVSMSRS